MKYNNLVFILILLSGVSCTSTKNLTYLQNLPETHDALYFPYDMPEYKVQHRDILYIEVKTLTSEGKLADVLRESGASGQTYIQGEASQYLIGYSVDKEDKIVLPVIGNIQVGGKALPEIRAIVQEKVDSVFNHAYVDVKLLSFKYTVLGEARSPGTFVNFNDYLTVLEAIGRAGGVGDYGRRDNVLVVRGTKDGTQTYRINLQDKNLLTSEAYFLMPNDVVIIEPVKHKIFNMNLPTISFTISTITGIISTTLLLINYFGK
jgi:polysaccharide biosynthesis/export protein